MTYPLAYPPKGPSRARASLIPKSSTVSSAVALPTSTPVRRVPPTGINAQPMDRLVSNAPVPMVVPTGVNHAHQAARALAKLAQMAVPMGGPSRHPAVHGFETPEPKVPLTAAL